VRSVVNGLDNHLDHERKIPRTWLETVIQETTKKALKCVKSKRNGTDLVMLRHAVQVSSRRGMSIYSGDH
jgi:hypothetical protein